MYRIPAFDAAFNALKVHHFGTDQVILHSREIRKREGAFACLRAQKKQEDFFFDLNRLISRAPFWIVSISIHKERLIQHTDTQTIRIAWR